MNNPELLKHLKLIQRSIEAHDTAEGSSPVLDDAMLELEKLINTIQGEKQMNVFDYFTQQLGASPREQTLRELDVTSTCGKDCVLVIDIARLLLSRCDSHADVRNPILDGINAAIEIFWLG